MDRDRDLRLGREAVVRKLLTPDQLKAAWEERENAEARGLDASLPEILVRLHLLSASHLAELLRELHAAAPVPQFDRYKIVGTLGEGGMAVVYRARDRELGREVALKVLKVPLAANPAVRERFHREARVTAGLHHPNLVTVFDAGESEGRLYLVMELIEGRPLSDALARRNYQIRSMTELLHKVARAVSAAHAKGIVHRDLKPSNILVTPEGEPKVTDFGLAHVSGSGVELTKTGAAIGTPLYMAPEQVRGESRRIGPHTDVYAMGAILYEILTGRPPHTGETPIEIYGKITREEPIPPRRQNRQAPRDLETICLKALDKFTGRRYPSADLFADDLKRFLDGEPILARPPSPIRKAVRWATRHRALSASAAGVAVGLLILAGVLTVRSVSLAGEVRRTLDQAALAEAEGRFGDAAELYAQAKALRPGHPVTDGKVVEMRGAAEAAARRAAADRHLAEGRAARADYQELRSEAHKLRFEERRLRAQTDAQPPPEAKRALWTLQRKLAAKEEAAATRFTDALAALNAALAADSGNAAARSELTALYFFEFERGEREGDRRSMALNARLARLYDDGTVAPKLVQEGTVELDSNPPGAEAFIFRYEESDDRRLVARPFGPTSRSSRLPEDGAATAPELDCTEFNRLGACPVGPVHLPSGSYLVVFRKPGVRDLRYPLFVTRGSRHADVVRLWTQAEIGEGYVPVPAGTFIMGGDPEAYESAERNPNARTDDFFMAIYEVTYGEWEQFLNDREFQSVEEASRRVPQMFGDMSLWIRKGDQLLQKDPQRTSRLPAGGIVWADAVAYGRWLDRRAAARGDKSVHRLPTNVEWEKAARGVDGRAFPWGDHFDWSFTSGYQSRPGQPAVEPVGTYRADESPYGVRDLAGSVIEWCDDWYDADQRYRHIRGSAWSVPAVLNFRSASRDGSPPENRSVNYGVRVVRVPPRP